MTLIVRRTKFVRRLREDERRGLFEKGEGEGDGSVAGEEADTASIIHRGSSSALSFPRPTGRGGYPNPLAGVFDRLGGLLHRPRASRRAAGGSADYLLDGMMSVRNSHFIGVRSEKHRSHVRLQSNDGRLTSQVICLEISAMSVAIGVLGVYWLGSQLIAVAIWAPYFGSGRYSDSFSEDPTQSRTWFAFFEAASMLNNCGLSLLDTSLSTFGDCYVLLLLGSVLMLGGCAVERPELADRPAICACPRSCGSASGLRTLRLRAVRACARSPASCSTTLVVSRT